MTRALRVGAFLLLAASAGAFALSTYVTSDSNWRPVDLPLPGPGLETATPFAITTSGKFRLEVTALAPVNAAELSTDPPSVGCDLEIHVSRDGRVVARQAITVLEYAGEYRFGKTYEFVGPTLRLSRGQYELRLTNHGSTDPFGGRGAAVSLSRFEGPTEAYLRSMLVRFLGWSALVVGLFIAIAAEVRTSSTTITENIRGKTA